MLEDLEKRKELIEEQLTKANKDYLAMTENLNTLKSQALQLQGHLNEIVYMKEQFIKFQEGSTADTISNGSYNAPETIESDQC